MVNVPAWVWRFGPVVRALIVGPAVGVVIGLLALFGSNSVLAGVVAFVIVSLLYGAIMGRRMAKFWPGAKHLNGSREAHILANTERAEESARRLLASQPVLRRKELRRSL